LFITFFWSLIITNGFLEMKFRFISQLFLVQSFKKNVILLCQNEVWNSNLSTITIFWLWAVKLSSSYYPIFFDGSWRIMDFIIKTSSPFYLFNKYEWRNSFMILSEMLVFFLQKFGHLILVEFGRILAMDIVNYQKIWQLS